MPQARGIVGQIAVIQLWVAAALLEYLHIRKTNADAVDPHQQLIVLRLGDRDGFRSAMVAHALQTRAVKIPSQAALGQGVIQRAIRLIILSHVQILSSNFQTQTASLASG